MPKKSRRKTTKEDSRGPVKILHMYGNAQWHDVCNEVIQLVKSEPPIDEEGKPVNFKPISDRRAMFENRVMRYIQYVKVFQKLDECLPLLIHPQKRGLLKKCVEGVATRICELMHEMIIIEKSLFTNFDDILFDLGLTPDDLNIRVPNYMYLDRHRVLSMRQHLLALMTERMRLYKDATAEDLMKSESELSLVRRIEEPGTETDSAEEVTIEVEKENARYSTKIPGRPYPICKVEPNNRYIPNQFIIILMEKVMVRKDEALTQKIVLLQAYWRGWLARQKIKMLRENEEVSLGMIMPKYLKELDPREVTEYEKKEKMCEDREEELAISKAIEHERFMAAHGHNMAWELKYNITQWLLELRDMQGTFPEYPEEEEGGCEKLFAMKTVEEVEQDILDMEEVEKNQGQKPPPPKKEPEKPKKAEAEEVGWTPAQTVAVPKLIDTLKEYQNYWYLKDEIDNVEQRFDRQLMLEVVRDEAGKQIRLQVDELMRYELDKLRCGIEMIEMPDGTETKKPKAVEKEKVTRDPLAHKTVEELYCELVLNGIVQPVNKIKLESFLGDYNFLDNSESYCVPTASDIKTLLTHLVLFPLSSADLHSNLPLTTRMLFAGPPGVGKTMLAHAICRETGANLMDISPSNLSGKYYGPEGQDYLMNALLKVGKSMEPTVFLVENCEVMYMRPVPGAPVGDDRPQRWAPVFYRMMDKIKAGDRMFLIGTTNDPFTCNNQAMFDLYRNIVYIPLPEYGSRVLMWKEFLSRMPICNCSSPTLNPSVLAKCSEGYSGKQIEDVVSGLLTRKRLSQFRPVSNKEFVRLLIVDPKGPLDDEIVWQWEDWYTRTPLRRKRDEMLLEEEEALEQLLAANAPRR